MKKQPAIASVPTGTLTVLSIGPLDDDHLPLEAIIRHTTWRLFQAHNLASAIALLQQHEIAVVLCERDLQPGTWLDVLERLHGLPGAPSLIVTSRLADDRLWVEALNLGVWDVLAKPFDRTEVIRSVKSAWQSWHDRTTAVKLAAAS